MNLSLTFGPRTRFQTGTVESIGDQMTARIPGAEDFEEALSIVTIRKAGDEILKLALFFDEKTPQGFGPRAKIAFTIRTLPPEGRATYGVDYALNVENAVVLEPAPQPAAIVASAGRPKLAVVS